MKERTGKKDRIIAALLALIMTMSMSSFVFAEDEGEGTDNGVPAVSEPSVTEEETSAVTDETDAAEEETSKQVIPADVDLSTAAISGIANKTYTGKALVQDKLVVKAGGITLSAGTHYTLSYKNNIKVGTATVTIKAVDGSGYTGSVSKTFRINSRTAKKVRLSGVDLVFKKTVLYDEPLAASCAPTNLQLTGAKNRIKLTWNRPSNIAGIDGYLVFRKTGNASQYTQIAAVGKNTATYTDKTAKKNKNYSYRLVAYKSAGGNIKVTSGTTYWVSGVTSNSYRNNVYKPKFKTKSPAKLSIGKSMTIKIKFPSRPKSKNIRWTTSNSKVAVVNSNGTVTAKGAGSCNIYARSATGRVAAFKITVPAPKKVLKGIDVSTWQNHIDWTKVKKAGIDFAFIRVGFRGSSSGKITLDNRYKENIKGAKGAGLKVGVYFFTQAKTYNEGVAEADFVYQQIYMYKMDLPVVIDTEYLDGRTNGLTRAQRTQAVKGFCEEMRRLGYTPMIYANLNWLDTKLDMSQLPYYVWVAQWNDKCTYKGKYKCWQYTSSGKVNGINGRVDLDYWYN